MKRKQQPNRLLDDHVVPYSPAVHRMLARLSKDSLLDLCIRWLKNPKCRPRYKRSRSDDNDGDNRLSTDEALSMYERMKGEVACKRKAVVQRIEDYEWSIGLNLLQLAQLDIQYLIDNPACMKWNVSRIEYANVDHQDDGNQFPFYPAAFIKKLRSSLGSSLTTHIYSVRHTLENLTIIRIHLYESTNTTALRTLPPSKRIYFCAFPSSSPHVFHTPTHDACHELMQHAIAESLSCFGREILLKELPLATKSLISLLHMKAVSRDASALGAWSIYAKNKVDKNPLSAANLEELYVSDDDAVEEDEHSKMMKNRKRIANARLGEDPNPVVERIWFQVQDSFPGAADTSFRPSVRVSFESKDVYSRIREYVEAGIVDGTRMPGWMTGEDAVTSGFVEDRKILAMR